ncbi:hypothetical protein ACFOGG_01785 [Brenneria rubrifaciens]
MHNVWGVIGALAGIVSHDYVILIATPPPGSMAVMIICRYPAARKG